MRGDDSIATISPILVVGAGPVGLTMAAELVRYGLPVRIIDKAASPTDKSKAVVVWGRTLEMLDRMGCVDDFLAAGIQARAAHLMAGRDQEIRIDFGLLDNPFPYALMLPQSETERLLTAHLARYGVEVERAVELTGITQDNSGVTTELRHAGAPGGEDRIEHLRVPWVIGCDGAHSRVRKLIGQNFAGHTFPTEWIMADLYLDGLPTPPGEPALFFHADGILALFPIGADRHYRLAANLGPAVVEGPGAELDVAAIQALITRRGPTGLRITGSSWQATFRINERQVEDYRSGRVFLAGDAAHIHSPAGGQGMNTGMQDAINLAWKLALVCRGGVETEALLASYTIERRAVGTQTLRVAGRMTALGLLKQPLLQMLRNRIAVLLMTRRPIQRALARQLSGLAVAYRHSPLNARGLIGATAQRLSGSRFPVTTRVGTPDHRPCFRLYGALTMIEAERLTGRFGRLLRLATENLPAELSGAGLWLIRPDGYVALAKTDAATVEHYLARLQVTPPVHARLPA